MKIKKYIEFILEKKISIDIPLPNDIIEISNAYIKSGKDIFVVGGAIRDFLQGNTPKDYDLVTNALPDESKLILKDFNVSDEQGKNFGVLRVYTMDYPDGYEIASYRKDISLGRDTKGDGEKVEMGNHITIKDDCMRRDLTINALFYDIRRKEIVDIVGGVEDIKSGIIKAVGNPFERFKEDRLRICRIFRFASRTGGEIDKITSDAIKSDNRLRGVNKKEDVSQERIWDEFKKAFKQSIDFKKYLSYLKEYDMWEQYFPGSVINDDFETSKNFFVVLGKLFENEKISKLEHKMVQIWNIEIDTAREVIFLINMLKLTPDIVFDLYKQKIRCHIKDQTIMDWLKVNRLDNVEIFNKFLQYKPSVDAQSLMEMGFQGKALGEEIKKLETDEFKKLLDKNGKD